MDFKKILGVKKFWSDKRGQEKFWLDIFCSEHILGPEKYKV